MATIRTVAQFGNVALYANDYGQYLLSAPGQVRRLDNADARRIEHELLIDEQGRAACSRRMFECVAQSYLA